MNFIREDPFKFRLLDLFVCTSPKGKSLRLKFQFQGSYKSIRYPHTFVKLGAKFPSVPEAVFFFHFDKVACGATSALHAVLNLLKLRFVGKCFLAPLPNNLSPSGSHFIFKGEISGPSFRFKGEKIWVCFKIKLEFSDYSFIVVGVFWATSENSLSKSGNCFSQIVECRACE